MQLEWARCEQGSWCRLNDVTVLNPNAVGVYIIWVQGRCIYVGQGRIADRIAEHRNPNSESGSRIRLSLLAANLEHLPLLVTWAEVGNQSTRDGVEAFLARACNPLVGMQFPAVLPIEVNGPW